MDRAKTTARREVRHLRFGYGAAYITDLTVVWYVNLIWRSSMVIHVIGCSNRISVHKSLRDIEITLGVEILLHERQEFVNLAWLLPWLLTVWRCNELVLLVSYQKLAKENQHGYSIIPNVGCPVAGDSFPSPGFPGACFTNKSCKLAVIFRHG